jgi:exopolysaccharide biosynthesis polyprenyl glycosylphosphotransferase
MRNSASDRAALKAVDLPVDAVNVPASSEHRRYRTSQPRLAIPLPAYDVRVRRELAHRRTIMALFRHVVRILSLHILDAAAATAGGLLAAKVVPVADSMDTLPLMVGLVLVGLNGRRAYDSAEGRRSPIRLLSGVLIALAAAVLVSRFRQPSALPVEYLVVFGVFTFATLLAGRALVDFVVRTLYAHGVGLRRAIIVGRASDAQAIVSALRSEAKDHFVVGHVSPGATADGEALGTLIELESIIQREEPVELIVSTPLSAEAHRRVADICVRNGVSILMVPQWNRSARGWAQPVKIGGMAAFWLHPVKLEVPQLVLKRATDLVITSILLVACIPLIALIALAIKIDSPGPVFFRQRRVGLGGRQFIMWKFRSMEHMSERRRDDIAHLNHYQDARLFKLKQDPRITRVGRWLRRFSLDELPQLFNVIAGEMSLVGPRPPLPKEVVKYEQRHFIRLTVVPGMTGPWQTSGRNLITDFEEVVRIERAYIEQWSLGLDLRIMAKTAGVMISGEGAY